ncbi:MAG: hypothetical protein AB1540_04010 [Bdellovibrionota bacterium]
MTQWSLDHVRTALTFLEKLEHCKATGIDFFLRNPEVESCSHNLRRFAEVVRARTGGHAENHQMGLEMPDKEYLQAVKDIVAFPKEFHDPSFWKINQDGSPNLQESVNYIDRKINSKLPPEEKWLAYVYEPKNLPFEKCLLVNIPGKQEKFIQVCDTGVALSVAVQAVAKGSTGDKILYQSPHASWPYSRSNKEPPIASKTIAAHSATPWDKQPRLTLHNCYQCHKMSIKPTQAHKIDSRYLERVEEFNSKAASYGTLSPFGRMKIEAYGPPIGPHGEKADQRRSLDFLKKCSEPARKLQDGKSFSDDALNRVKSAMDCSRCHFNGEGGKGAFNFPTAFTLPITEKTAGLGKMPEMQHEFESYILTGAMPPDVTLDDYAERAALVYCLRQEYYQGTKESPGVMQAWLQEGDCGVLEEQASINKVDSGASAQKQVGKQHSSRKSRSKNPANAKGHPN